MSAEARLKDKGITLPTPTTPLANYVGAVQTGNLLFLSGHGPFRPQGKFTRQLFLGESLDADQVAATYEHGVLTLTVPVSERATPRRVEISGHAEQGAIETGARDDHEPVAAGASTT